MQRRISLSLHQKENTKPVMDYPHTTIEKDLSALRFRHPESADNIQNVLDMYTRKKSFFVARIAELESQLSEAQHAKQPVVAASSTQSAAATSMEYPHTAIQSYLSSLRASLEESNSPDKQERLDKLAEVRDGYNAKRNWFTAVRAGRTDVSYPHTTVQNDMAELQDMLEESGSPMRQRRLDLLESARADYQRKRAWFRTLPH